MEVKNEKGYLLISMQPNGKMHNMRADLISQDEGNTAWRNFINHLVKYADNQKYISHNALQMYEFQKWHDTPVIYIETKAELENLINPLMVNGDCVLKQSVSLPEAVYAKRNGIDIFSPETNLKEMKNHSDYLRFLRSNTRPELIISGKIKRRK